MMFHYDKQLSSTLEELILLGKYTIDDDFYVNTDYKIVSNCEGPRRFRLTFYFFYNETDDAYIKTTYIEKNSTCIIKTSLKVSMEGDLCVATTPYIHIDAKKDGLLFFETHGFDFIDMDLLIDTTISNTVEDLDEDSIIEIDPYIEEIDSTDKKLRSLLRKLSTASSDNIKSKRLDAIIWEFLRNKCSIYEKGSYYVINNLCDDLRIINNGNLINAYFTYDNIIDSINRFILLENSRLKTNRFGIINVGNLDIVKRYRY